MEAPFYLNHIEAVANRFGDVSNYGKLFMRMCSVWGSLENKAKDSKWDILDASFPLDDIERMVELLYRTPASDAVHDVNVIRIKDQEYGGSWYRRGGAGAFMMLARKWDRIEQAVVKHGTGIFDTDTREEGIRDDFGDLRRYLILVLSWHYAANADQAQQDIPF